MPRTIARALALFLFGCSGASEPPAAPPPPEPVPPSPVAAMDEPPVLDPVPDPPAIALGTWHGCAVRSGGLACWGGFRADAPPSPVAVPGFTGASGVAIADRTTCVLDGSIVSCFGAATLGRLGAGVDADTETPVAIAGLDSVIDLDGGGRGLCALRSGGEVACWGGVGTRDLTTLGGMPRIVDVDVGESASCGLGADGSVWCWGENGRGELGDGTTEPRTGPVRAIERGARSVSVGRVACAVRDDGTLSCWGGFGLWMFHGPPGAEGYAELGCDGRVVPGSSGSLDTWCPRPFTVPGIAGAVEVAVGTEIIAVRFEGGRIATLDTSLTGPVAPIDRHGPDDALPVWPLPAADGTSGLVAYGRRACGRRAESIVCFGHAGLGGVADSHGELGLGAVGTSIGRDEIGTVALP
jgi:hypothetical protein